MSERIRLLFVDDETRILDGLRRMLRSQREVWEMDFVTSGAQALELLDRQPIDVIVSDMRMPEMDGAELLSEVRRRHAEVVRVVLSGHADRDLILKAIPATHLYLSKPCDPDVLRSAIERSACLRALLTDRRIRQHVSQCAALPSAPRVYEQLLLELNLDDGSTIARVAQLIERDVALAAHILRLVNAGFFGLPRSIASLEKAVGYLGLDTLRSVVLAAEIQRSFRGGVGHEAELARIWAHSARTGHLAERIAQRLGWDVAVSTELFCAGLVHEAGRLLFEVERPALVGALHALREAEPESPATQLEQRVLDGVSLSAVGAYILGLWGLPIRVVEMVLHHRAPDRSPPAERQVVAALHVANALAGECERADSRPIDDQLDQQLVASLGWTEYLAEWRAYALEQVHALVAAP